MKKDIFNFKITSTLKTVGKFDMPKISKFEKEKLRCEFLIALPFNYAMSEMEPESKICHFYLDDYQFERVWREPDTYVPILKKFNAVIGADFSMFENFPYPQQIYNNWRNKVLMAYWQSQGVNVIPNIQWSNEKSFDYCFDGYSPGGLVAVSSVGCRDKHAKELFMKGYTKMTQQLHPDKVILIGKVPQALLDDEKIINIPSFMEQRRQIWAEEEAILNHKTIQ